MQCPSCNEPMENLGLGANPAGGRVASIFFCIGCDKHFRSNPPSLPLDIDPESKAKPTPQAKPEDIEKKPGVVAKVKMKAGDTVKKFEGPAGEVAKSAGKAAAVTGLRTAATMLEKGTPATAAKGSAQGSSNWTGLHGGRQYNVSGRQVGNSEPRAMWVDEIDEKTGEVLRNEDGTRKGRWVPPGHKDYIDPPDSFWQSYGGDGPKRGGLGGLDLRGLLGGLQGLSPEMMMKVVPQVALIDGAVQVLNGPGGQELLGSVGKGAHALLGSVGSGAGELLGKEGLGAAIRMSSEAGLEMAKSEQVQTGVGKTLGSVGELVGKEGVGKVVGSLSSPITAPSEIVKGGLSGSTDIVKGGLGSVTGLVGQKQQLEHELEMAKLGFGPGGQRASPSPQLPVASPRVAGYLPQSNPNLKGALKKGGKAWLKSQFVIPRLVLKGFVKLSVRDLRGKLIQHLNLATAIARKEGADNIASVLAQHAAMIRSGEDFGISLPAKTNPSLKAIGMAPINLFKTGLGFLRARRFHRTLLRASYIAHYLGTRSSNIVSEKEKKIYVAIFNDLNWLIDAWADTVAKNPCGAKRNPEETRRYRGFNMTFYPGRDPPIYIYAPGHGQQLWGDNWTHAKKIVDAELRQTNPPSISAVTEAVVTSPFKERYMNPKEESLIQFLERITLLPKGKKLSKEDATLMQNLLRTYMDLPNAEIVDDKVYLYGTGNRSSVNPVNSVALIILNQFGLEEQKSAGGGAK